MLPITAKDTSKHASKEQTYDETSRVDLHLWVTSVLALTRSGLLTNSVSIRAVKKSRRTIMRKRMKKKLRSCPLCKPHKTGGENRWSAKERDRLERAERQMRNARASS
jgi:hypothetical protein